MVLLFSFYSQPQNNCETFPKEKSTIENISVLWYNKNMYTQNQSNRLGVTKMNKYKSVGDALTYIIETDGIKALLNSRRCINILNDLVPERQEEIVLVRHVFDHDLIRILITANSGNQTVRQQAINRLNDELIRSVRISESASSDICGTFVKVLKWDVTVPNDEKKRKQKEQEKQVRKEQRRTIGKWMLQRWKAILILIVCFTLFVMLYSPVRTMIEHIGKVHWLSSADLYIGRDYEEVKSELEKIGFLSVQAIEKADLNVVNTGEEHHVFELSINGESFSQTEEWYPKESSIVIYYHGLSENYCFELPFSNTDLTGLDTETVKKQLDAVGFQNITTKAHHDLKLGQRNQIGTVKYVKFDDYFLFNKGDLKPHDSQVCIVYHAYSAKNSVTLGKSLSEMLGMDYNELKQELIDAGFSSNNISIKETDDITNDTEAQFKEMTVANVTFDGKRDYLKNDPIPEDTQITIYYHVYSNKYRIFTPQSAAELTGKHYTEVVYELKNAGFEIELNRQHEYSFSRDDGEVLSVSIDDNTGFGKDAAFPRNTKAIITYYKGK